MAINGQIIAYEPLRSLGFVSITLSYVGVGSPFANPCRMIMIDNLTDAELMVSFDGVNDHTVVAANSGKVLDYASNKILPVGQLEQPLGTRVYVKYIGSAPTIHNVYVSVIYAANS